MRIEEKVNSASDQLERIDKAVFTGNGQPGLMSRVTAIEAAGSKGDRIVGVWLSVFAIVVALLSAIAAWAR